MAGPACAVLFSLSIFALVLTAQLGQSYISHLLPINHHPHINSTQLTTRVQTCPYSIVYNKPPKTGSTAILKSIQKWAGQTNRTVYSCSGYIRFNKLTLPECVPVDRSGCAVVAMHIELNDRALQLLRERLGQFKLITSTRLAVQRILSEALQWHALDHESASKNLTLVKQYLQQFNPWSLYNYHMGDTLVGDCPLTRTQEMLLYDLASRYDIIVDGSLLEKTNTLLNASGLFQLSPERVNVRGVANLTLDVESLRLLKRVSCVEDMMHKVLRMRMAFLYGRVIGRPCLKKTRFPEPCF